MTSALLFDLGGVLIEFSFSRALAHWAPYSALSADELRQRFRFDDAYARHERGELTADAYFRHLADTLELDAPVEEIAAGWNAIFIAEITAVTAQVAACALVTGIQRCEKGVDVHGGVRKRRTARR